MAGVDGRTPHEDYRNLKQELKLYQGDLVRRPSLVVANKMDCPESGENLAEFVKETGETPLQISAKDGDGISDLRDAIFSMLNT
jgi:GTP-binding protein